MLSQFGSLTEEQVQLFLDHCDIREYPEGKALLREGQMAVNSYFVINGCIRSYYIKGGQEINSEFFVENDVINPVSLTLNTPSAYYLECLEDCTVSVGHPDKTASLYELFPAFSVICHRMNAHLEAQRKIVADRFRKLSAQEHYLTLLQEKPTWFNRVSQYHIASYLGIQPQSLSRIRKRMAEQK